MLYIGYFVISTLGKGTKSLFLRDYRYSISDTMLSFTLLAVSKLFLFDPFFIFFVYYMYYLAELLRCSMIWSISNYKIWITFFILGFGHAMEHAKCDIWKITLNIFFQIDALIFFLVLCLFPLI